MPVIEQCRSCGADVIWAVTTNDKRMPVDAEPTYDGRANLVLVETLFPGGQPLARSVPPGEGTHTSHFATCKQADEWRKR